MKIRVLGRKPQVDNSQPSIPTEAPSAGVTPVEGNTQVKNQLDNNQINALENVATPYPMDKIGSTRASRAWSRILPALILLAIILVFVFQNLGTTKITFIVFSGTVPLALALIVAAALGGILVLTIGSIRIMQLRKIIHGRANSSATPSTKSSTHN